MKKLLLGVSIASVLGLAGCGGDETIAELKQQVGTTQPASRIIFDPSNGKLPVPTNLLLSGTDGTLNMPGETAASDYTDASFALGALDGWSTSTPFVVSVDTADGVYLDVNSVQQPGAVLLFEVNLDSPYNPAAGCAKGSTFNLCTVARQLAFGTEFVTTAAVDGTDIQIVPMQPLKPKQAYMLVVTNKIMDTNGNPVKGSSTYETVAYDVDDSPLPLASQLKLQKIINSYEDGAVEQGLAKDEIIYTAAFTTESTDDVLAMAKLVMLQQTPVLEPFEPYIVNQVTGAGSILASQGLIDTSTDDGQKTLAGANRASVFKSVLHTPYYLDKPSAADCVLTIEQPSPNSVNCPKLFSRFKALGDSPITVIGALMAGALTESEFLSQYAVQQGARPDFVGTPAYAGDPKQYAGMTFKVGGQQLDSVRHTTRWNPMVAPTKLDAEVAVLVTMPNINQINVLREAAAIEAGITWDAATMAMVDPGATGWPVMIYSHGITTTKETLLAFAGAMAEAGVVVVAIDHPLHGVRLGSMLMSSGMTLPDGTVLTADTPVPLSASAVKNTNGDVIAKAQPTAYLNLASLLTGRDNLRQSELDLLALRVSLNGLTGTVLDLANVSFYGHSLGAITGIPFTSVANTVNNPANGLYEVSASSLLAPGGSIASMLQASDSFGPVVKAGLIASDSFQEELINYAKSINIDEATLTLLKDSNDPQYDQLVEGVYAPFVAQFNFAAQTILDAGDPVNYAKSLGETTDSIHLIKVIDDAVIPNSVETAKLAGTDPLSKLMGLDQFTSTLGDGSTAVKGEVEFSEGHHSSMLRPNAEDDDPITAADVQATVEMQTQLANFIGSEGKLIKITDSSVIAP